MMCAILLDLKIICDYSRDAKDMEETKCTFPGGYIFIVMDHINNYRHSRDLI